MRASEFVTERKSAEDIYLDALARQAKAASKRYQKEKLRQHVNSARKELSHLEDEDKIQRTTSSI
jgi:hypothetical protein